MSLFNLIDKSKVPKHVAIIMDGNGRWAKRKGKPRIFGHKNGVQSVREVIEAAGDLNIEFLTLYAFSTENWQRPITEVNALMRLLVETLRKEIRSMNENNIRLLAIGNIDELPERSKNALLEGVEATKNNTKFNLVLALNYSGRWDLVEAVKKISADVSSGKLEKGKISRETIDRYLSTSQIPHPELLIRTSGEIRVSNFLLWEIAYAELVFTPVLWPEFRKEEFFKCILEYQNRERRFGKTGDQLIKA